MASYPLDMSEYPIFYPMYKSHEFLRIFFLIISTYPVRVLKLSTHTSEEPVACTMTNLPTSTHPHPPDPTSKTTQ